MKEYHEKIKFHKVITILQQCNEIPDTGSFLLSIVLCIFHPNCPCNNCYGCKHLGLTIIDGLAYRHPFELGWVAFYIEDTEMGILAYAAEVT